MGETKFRFKNKLISIDATVIKPCASLFDWAKFRRTKGAVKLHLLLDHEGYLPQYAHITEGKVHEVNVFKKLRFSPGTIVVFDRGLVDYQRIGISSRTRSSVSQASRLANIVRVGYEGSRSWTRTRGSRSCC